MNRKISPKNAEWVALLAMLMSLLFGVLTFLVAKWCRSQAAFFEVWHFIGGCFIWMLALLHLRQQRTAAEEKIEDADFEDSLFEEKEKDPYSAQGRLEYFEKWGVPLATAFIALGMLVGGVLLFSHYSKTGEPAKVIHAPISAAFLCGFAFFSLLVSKYALGMARQKIWRLLRGGGSYLFVNAVACFLCAVFVALTHMGWYVPEHWFAAVIPLFMAVIGIELLLRLLLDVYRPRVAGQDAHPPYDSRLLDLCTGSKGFLRTIAQTLDYQFGFKISDTWFYQFSEKAILPLLLFMALSIEALSCVVVVDACERVVIEKFGKPRATLEAGFHLKWPWPVEKAYYFPVDRVHTVLLGFEEEEHAKNLIYTNPGHEHAHKHSLFMIAHRNEEQEILRRYHFSDIAGMFRKLKSADDLISREVRTAISPNGKRLLAGYQGETMVSEAMQAELIKDLNELLRKDFFFELFMKFYRAKLAGAVAADGVCLSPFTLANQDGPSDELSRLMRNPFKRKGLVRSNRLLLQACYPQEMTRLPERSLSLQPYALRSEDFKDLEALAAKLKEGADPVSAYLWRNFSKPTQKLLDNYHEFPQKMQLALIDELNQLIERQSLYQKQRFAQVSLDRQTKKLVDQNPKSDDRILLNRMLLEQAYSREIGRSRDIQGRTAPVNMLAINVLINYKIKPEGVLDYMQHKAPEVLLKGIGNRELTRYLASIPMENLLGAGRLETYPQLRELLQNRCDEMKLGISIVFMGVCVAHPPTKTASAFEEVLQAEEQMETEILKAQTRRQKVLPKAESDAHEVISKANIYRYEKEKITASEALAFENYMQAYRFGKEFYLCRKYLEVLERHIPGKRLYVVCVPGSSEEITELNLEDPLSTGFTQLDLTSKDEGSQEND